MTDKNSVIQFLVVGDLESAETLLNETGISLERSDIDPISRSLAQKAAREHARGEMGLTNRLNRRRLALEDFFTRGLDPERMIPKVIMPDGYQGKILMAYLTGGVADGTACLRSGDQWHREILKATQEEIEDLGFTASTVSPMGGAWVRFKPGRTIEIYGNSDDFGACDMTLAARLIRKAFPDRKVMIQR